MQITCSTGIHLQGETIRDSCHKGQVTIFHLKFQCAVTSNETFISATFEAARQCLVSAVEVS